MFNVLTFNFQGSNLQLFHRPDAGLLTGVLKVDLGFGGVTGGATGEVGDSGSETM